MTDSVPAQDEAKYATMNVDWIGANISHAITYMKSIVLIYVLTSMYGITTLMGLKDIDLAVKNEVHLPVLGLSISNTLFAVAFPLTLALLHIILFVYHSRLRDLTYIQLSLDSSRGNLRLNPWFFVLTLAEPTGLVTLFARLIELVLLRMWLPLISVVTMLAFVKTHQQGLFHVMIFVSLLLVIWQAWTNYVWVFSDHSLSDSWRKTQKPNLTWRSIMLPTTLLTLIWFLLIGTTGCYVMPNSRLGWPNSENNKLRSILKAYFTLDLSYAKITPNPDSNQGIYVDARGVEWQGANLRYSILRGVDLSGSDLSYARVEGLKIENCLIDSANLRSLSGFLVDSQAISKQLETAPFYSVDRAVSISFKDSYITNSDFDNSRLMMSRFDNCSLRKVSFKECEINLCKLTDTRGESINFARANLSQSTLKGKCELNNSNFVDSQLDKVSVDSLAKVIMLFCKFENANLHGSSLLNTTLYGSSGLECSQICEAIYVPMEELSPTLQHCVAMNCPQVDSIWFANERSRGQTSQ